MNTEAAAKETSRNLESVEDSSRNVLPVVDNSIRFSLVDENDNCDHAKILLGNKISPGDSMQRNDVTSSAHARDQSSRVSSHIPGTVEPNEEAVIARSSNSSRRTVFKNKAITSDRTTTNSFPGVSSKANDAKATTSSPTSTRKCFNDETTSCDDQSSEYKQCSTRLPGIRLNEITNETTWVAKKRKVQSFARTRAERNKNLKSPEENSSMVDKVDFVNEFNGMEQDNTKIRGAASTNYESLPEEQGQVVHETTSSHSNPTSQLENPWQLSPVVSSSTVHIVTQNSQENLDFTDNSPTRPLGSYVDREYENKRIEVRRSDSREELEQIEANHLRCRKRTCQSGANTLELQERVRSDLELLTRPSWCDARFALSRVQQGRAEGNVHTLRFRAFLQHIFIRFGCFIQRNAWLVLLISLIFLTACSIGLKEARMENDIEKLWVETGGTLEEELKYTKQALATITAPSTSYSSGGSSQSSSTGGAEGGFTYNMLIQTGLNTLTVDSLLLHLRAAQAATEVTVTMYDQTWTFSDVCFKLSAPIEGETEAVFAAFLEKVFPCFIITPLDCFWEGSKLLGPNPPLRLGPAFPDLSWKNLNPTQILDEFIKVTHGNLAEKLNAYKDILQQAGVTTGYTERWCLNPHDPECPKTAPNYESKKVPDVKALFTAGCAGFATQFLQWPLDLIVGGVQRNASKYVSSAQGLQTLINLMGVQNMYEFHKGIKGGHDWSVNRANQILTSWQKKFVDRIYAISQNKNATGNNSDDIHAFSAATAGAILEEFSKVSYLRVAGGYLLMVGYACFSLMRFRSSRSQGAVGVLGVLLVALSVSAGLGICSVVGISFNAASTQVLPFLLLGLGVDDMFLMAHHFEDIAVLSYIPFQERTGECLKRVGVSVFLTSIAILSGFLFSLIIPMPALRAFGSQAAIVTAFNLLSVLVVFPAILSIDLLRRKHNKLDILCCFNSANVNEVVDLTARNTHHNGTCRVHYQRPSGGGLDTGPDETTITMRHTIQAYSNDGFMTVLGPRTNARGSNAPPTRSGGIPPYEQIPRTPPPQYSSENAAQDNSRSFKTTNGRPRVAFVNQAIEPSTGRSTPSGRYSRRGNGSNPPTNLTTPMESVRSSTHSLVPHRRRSRWLGCCGGRDGTWYTRLQTLPSLTINQLGERYYAPFLLKKPVRVSVIVLFLGLLGASIYGCTIVEDGLDFSDVLPRGTREHAAVVAQQTYFSFYNIYIVTKSFDYASNQRAMHDLHDAMGNLNYVMRNTDGTLPKWWLQYFRDWLQDLQNEFDDAWRRNEVNSSTWTPQASDKAVFAFKLLLQTGRNEEPVNYDRIGCSMSASTCNQADIVRLVSDDGIIREDAFYNYLSAWYTDDPFAYAAAQAEIRPLPLRWSHSRNELNYVIPRSPAIIYAQMPFYLNNMRENQDFVDVINWVRDLIHTTEATTDVTAYPSGYPFTFWQQYIDLRFWLLVSLGCVMLAVFLVLSLVLFNPWASAIMALFLAMIATELLGFMGASNVKLSAVPAVILVAALGLGVEFTVHITFAFITSCGTREERVKLSIGHMLGPVIDGSISTLLGVIMLAGAEFDFVIKYFFLVLLILILLGVLNGLVLLPVVLSLIGPPPEVIPLGGGSRLKTPTPPPSPPQESECSCPMSSGRPPCNANGSRNSNYCYYHRRPNYHMHHLHQHEPHCKQRRFYSSGNHAYHPYPSGSPQFPASGERVWPQTTAPRHHHADCIHHVSHCGGRCARSGPSGLEPNLAWQHPFAVPTGSGEDTERVFVYPRAEYVFYSPQAQSRSGGDKNQHCETNMINATSSDPPQGAHQYTQKETNAKIPTLTATSSLTVKVHSNRRKPVVAFLEPPSTSTNFPNTPDTTWRETYEPGTPLQSRPTKRRFDLSSVTEREKHET